MSKCKRQPCELSPVKDRLCIYHWALENVKAVDPEQSAQGSGEVRELLCQLCDAEYPVWFAPNELWNKVMRWPDGRESQEIYPFVCMDCFGKEADKHNIKHGAWKLTDAAETGEAPDVRAKEQPDGELAPTPAEAENE